jgi:hypothetical protein
MRSCPRPRLAPCVDAAYAELDSDDSPIDAVRLTWSAGAPAPQVAEIILSEVE